MCNIVVCPACTADKGTAPEPPPKQPSKVFSQNSATLSAGGLAVFCTLVKLLAFTTAATAFWAAFLN